ncbi:zinc finger protein 41 homolog [Perca flavescens]|uniref:zinc finger protein 41 homolog n=1 Tax=Perca flavescens TaxID=8167 RepID=UPI00106E0617|nr:zinc finger protein 41 homolog [Perca flavescens]
METEADGEEAARNFLPPLLLPPETGDSVDSDFWKESRERLAALNSLEDDGLEDDGWNTERTSFSCCECGKRFVKFWNLKRHVRRVHSGEKSSVSRPGERTAIEEDEPEPPPHIKEEEEELFPFTPVPVKSEDDEEKGLPPRPTEHTETETEDSVDSDFWKETRESQSSSNSLKREQVPVSEERRKTDKKSLFCSECGKRFGAVGDLNRHVRTHTGEKPFSCSVCCRRFLTSTHLKTHMRTHTGEKPYSCAFCDKRFGHSGNLTEHMNMHTGEKRFSCSLCDKTFTWRQQVKKHKCVQSQQLPRRPSEDRTADCSRVTLLPEPSCTVTLQD